MRRDRSGFRTLLLVIVFICSNLGSIAQTSIDIYLSNGDVVQLPTNSFDSITFDYTAPPPTYWILILQPNGDTTAFDLSTIDSIGYSIGTPGNPSIVETNSLAFITSSSVISEGEVSGTGGTNVTHRGFCWSDQSNPPSTADMHNIVGAGSGVFTDTITGLVSNTTYNVRAYATNSNGTSYGSTLTFNTFPPIVTAPGNGMTDIDGNSYPSVIIGDQEWAAENLRTTHYANGDPIPQVTDGNVWSGLATDAFSWYDNDNNYSSPHGGLYNGMATADDRNACPYGWHAPNNNEWLELLNYLGGDSIAGGRMKATGNNAAGTGLWNQPNREATNESGFSAVPNGRRSNSSGNYQGLNSEAAFWTSTMYDVLGGINYTINSSSGSVGSNVQVTGISTGKLGFAVRCLKNPPGGLSAVHTVGVFDINHNKATCLGVNHADATAPAITERGICWSTSSTPTLSNDHMAATLGSGKFRLRIEGLSANTTYFYRTYATNSAGTSYGNIESFTTTDNQLFTDGSGVTDVDGNFYPSIIIDGMEWTTLNLTTSRFSNGDPIVEIELDQDWEDTQDPAFCWYHNDSIRFNYVYGKLYNWITVDDSRNVCPVGWHVPDTTEWTQLRDFLGPSVAGKKMKSPGSYPDRTGRWWYVSNATNESGFSAIPTSFRSDDGTYIFSGNIPFYISSYWTSTHGPTAPYGASIGVDYDNLGMGPGHQNLGRAIRCVKD